MPSYKLYSTSIKKVELQKETPCTLIYTFKSNLLFKFFMRHIVVKVFKMKRYNIFENLFLILFGSVLFVSLILVFNIIGKQITHFVLNGYSACTLTKAAKTFMCLGKILCFKVNYHLGQKQYIF